jgi:phosphatidate cytidylyltransferase
MKTRIIVAVIFVPLLFIILFFLPPVAVTLLIAGIAVIASEELLRATGSAAQKRLYIYAAVPAAIIPAAVYLGSGDPVFRAVLFLLMALLFIDAVLSYQKENRIRLAQLAAVLFGGAVIPYFLSAIVSLKLEENGRYYVLIPFIVAFITDGGAYFTGVFFGKHKAFPAVSPKKTIEGCVGGIMTGVAGTVLLGVILHLAAGGFAVNFWALAVYGLAGGIVTEFGDLAFSLIKREFGIKDYGRLIPGHGGMLDRFDSMIFAAPAIYMLSSIFPAF